MIVNDNPVRPFALSTYESLVAFNGDILFEWDLETDRFYTTPNLFDIFGYLPSSYNFTATLETSENIHPDDKKVIKDFLETIQFIRHDLKNRKFYSKIELRIKNAYRKYVWCKVQLIADYSPQNMPYKISGMITNIDFDKKHQENILLRGQKDLLTDLYNKESFQRLVSTRLQDKQAQHKSGAFLLVNLDGFAAINQQFGYAFGDAVIADTAVILYDHFLTSDLTGRLSGDTFSAYIQDVTILADLKNRLTILKKRLNRSYTCGTETHILTVSIGIALYPAHGKTYEELYTSASHALSYVKRREKNEFMLFRERMPWLEPQGELAKPVAMQNLASYGSFEKNFSAYAVKIISTTADTKAAIHLLLSIVGRKHKLSRTFFCQKDTAKSLYIKQFEWCEPYITAIDYSTEQVDAVDLDNYYNHFSTDSLLCYNDIILAPNTDLYRLNHSDAKACLHLLTDNGCIGFDDCQQPRQWSEKEIHLLRFLSDLCDMVLKPHPNPTTPLSRYYKRRVIRKRQ